MTGSDDKDDNDDNNDDDNNDDSESNLFVRSRIVLKHEKQRSHDW